VPVRIIGIVGAGTMGASIAQVSAVAGFDVILSDINEFVTQKGLAGIAQNLDRLVADKKVTPAERDSALQRITEAAGYEVLQPADLVIEAVPENPEVKIQVLREIAAAIRLNAIIATNTSSVSITRLASAISHPERFIGMQFFNPAPAVSLIEIVRGLQTSDATHDAVERLVVRLGKVPVTVKNSPGFVVNRILLPMLNEAFFVLAEGDADPTDIDSAMKLGCRHPMGPLALADLIGLDVLLAVMQTLHNDFGDSKYRPAPFLGELVAAGYLGRKSGRGVYRY